MVYLRKLLLKAIFFINEPHSILFVDFCYVFLKGLGHEMELKYFDTNGYFWA
jgi:hypothetical protein